MKKITTLFILFFCFILNAQTPITDANFGTAIDTCLSTNPVDGMCSDSEYGAMPDWDVSQVTYMTKAFNNKTNFNTDISDWDVSNVVSMYGMFDRASSFNQNISDWDVSDTTIIMYAMFYKAYSFNQDISSWDVSKVVDMRYMFESAISFNQDIGSWDVGNVDDMQSMFNRASSFNQDIGSWDVGEVVDMNAMFYEASSFDQNISSWNVENVVDMFAMFWEATSFDQDISSWDVANVENMAEMFDNSSLSTENYDALLKSWSSLNLQQGVIFGAKGVNYCLGEAAMENITDTHGWSISNAGLNCSEIINKIDVYPSPAKNHISLKESEVSVGATIYNIRGKKVITVKNTKNIALENLPSGIYTVRISDGVSQSFKRFIKL